MNLKFWLILNNARNLSPFQCTRLLERWGDPQKICEPNAAELIRFGLKPEAIEELLRPDNTAITQQLEWGAQLNQSILTLEDPAYPSLLKAIADPPPVLFVRGDPKILSKPQLALVGSRKPSPSGLRAAAEFAKGLVAAGWAITSGLAAGIDAASHKGALSTGGTTVAVLGSGLDQIYPAQNKGLATQIASRGALVSEFPPHTPPLAMHFPRRNRIISGLCLGVAVVEAALRSGSLITAKLALEQGREVFAVPGSIYNPLSQGCHILIQEGAKLVTGPADVLLEFEQSPLHGV